MPAVNFIKKSLDIVLSYPPLGLIHATTSAADERGMAIQTGRITLNRNSEVQITFSVHEGRKIQVHRILAQVLSSNEDGTRLRYSSCPQETMQLLRQIVPTT